MKLILTSSPPPSGYLPIWISQDRILVLTQPQLVLLSGFCAKWITAPSLIGTLRSFPSSLRIKCKVSHVAFTSACDTLHTLALATSLTLSLRFPPGFLQPC